MTSDVRLKLSISDIVDNSSWQNKKGSTRLERSSWQHKQQYLEVVEYDIINFENQTRPKVDRLETILKVVKVVSLIIGVVAPFAATFCPAWLSLGVGAPLSIILAVISSNLSGRIELQKHRIDALLTTRSMLQHNTVRALHPIRSSESGEKNRIERLVGELDLEDDGNVKLLAARDIEEVPLDHEREWKSVQNLVRNAKQKLRSGDIEAYKNLMAQASFKGFVIGNKSQLPPLFESATIEREMSSFTSRAGFCLQLINQFERLSNARRILFGEAFCPEEFAEISDEYARIVSESRTGQLNPEGISQLTFTCDLLIARIQPLLNIVEKEIRNHPVLQLERFKADMDKYNGMILKGEVIEALYGWIVAHPADAKRPIYKVLRDLPQFDKVVEWFNFEEHRKYLSEPVSLIYERNQAMRAVFNEANREANRIYAALGQRSVTLDEILKSPSEEWQHLVRNEPTLETMTQLKKASDPLKSIVGNVGVSSAWKSFVLSVNRKSHNEYFEPILNPEEGLQFSRSVQTDLVNKQLQGLHRKIIVVHYLTYGHILELISEIALLIIVNVLPASYFVALGFSASGLLVTGAYYFLGNRKLKLEKQRQGLKLDMFLRDRVHISNVPGTHPHLENLRAVQEQYDLAGVAPTWRRCLSENENVVLSGAQNEMAKEGSKIAEPYVNSLRARLYYQLTDMLEEVVDGETGSLINSIDENLYNKQQLENLLDRNIRDETTRAEIRKLLENIKRSHPRVWRGKQETFFQLLESSRNEVVSLRNVLQNEHEALYEEKLKIELDLRDYDSQTRYSKALEAGMPQQERKATAFEGFVLSFLIDEIVAAMEGDHSRSSRDDLEGVCERIRGLRNSLLVRINHEKELLQKYSMKALEEKLESCRELLKTASDSEKESLMYLVSDLIEAMTGKRSRRKSEGIDEVCDRILDLYRIPREERVQLERERGLLQNYPIEMLQEKLDEAADRMVQLEPQLLEGSRVATRLQMVRSRHVMNKLQFYSYGLNSKLSKINVQELVNEESKLRWLHGLLVEAQTEEEQTRDQHGNLRRICQQILKEFNPESAKSTLVKYPVHQLKAMAELVDLRLARVKAELGKYQRLKVRLQKSVRTQRDLDREILEAQLSKIERRRVRRGLSQRAQSRKAAIESKLEQIAKEELDKKPERPFDRSQLELQLALIESQLAEIEEKKVSAEHACRKLNPLVELEKIRQRIDPEIEKKRKFTKDFQEIHQHLQQMQEVWAEAAVDGSLVRALGRWRRSIPEFMPPEDSDPRKWQQAVLLLELENSAVQQLNVQELRFLLPKNL